MFALVVKGRDAVVTFEILGLVLPMLLRSDQVLSKSSSFCFLLRKMDEKKPQWSGVLNLKINAHAICKRISYTSNEFQ